MGCGLPLERQRRAAQDGKSDAAEVDGASRNGAGAAEGAAGLPIEGLRDELAQRAIVVGYGSIRRFFEREGITRKKRR